MVTTRSQSNFDCSYNCGYSSFNTQFPESNLKKHELICKKNVNRKINLSKKKKICSICKQFKTNITRHEKSCKIKNDPVNILTKNLKNTLKITHKKKKEKFENNVNVYENYISSESELSEYVTDSD